jgi:hypothetical protein
MSGGHFNYNNDRACSEIFGWRVSADYGTEGFKQSKIARRMNPLEDLVISELVFDVFCLLHSYDWYVSGDNCEETYREDVKRFKEKWLKSLSNSHLKEIVNDETSRLRDELYKAFNIESEDTE